MANIVLFDVDGVLAKTIPEIRNKSLEMFGKPIPDNWLGNDLTKEELSVILTPEFYRNLEVFEDVIPCISKLKEKGYAIWLVTNRNVPKQVTLSWVIRNEIPYDLVTFEDKDSRIKLIRTHTIKYLVEDNFNTALAAAPNCAISFYIKREWNIFDHDSIQTIFSLEEIPNFLPEIK